METCLFLLIFIICKQNIRTCTQVVNILWISLALLVILHENKPMKLVIICG